MKIQILTNGEEYKVLHETFWGWKPVEERIAPMLYVDRYFPTEGKARKYIKERWGTEAEIAPNTWRAI